MNYILGYEKVKNQVIKYLKNNIKMNVDYLCIDTINTKDNVLSMQVTGIELFEESYSCREYQILARYDKEYNLTEITHTKILE